MKTVVIFTSEDGALIWKKNDSNADTCVLGNEVTHLGSQ